MYIRFVSPQWLDRRRGNSGIFSAALDVVYDSATPEHFYLPLRELLDWFNDHLPAPDDNRFAVRSRKREIEVGICWFRADALDMLRNAHLMAAILRDYGVVIAHITTRDPGQLLYCDPYQVVAKPAPHTPTIWH